MLTAIKIKEVNKKVLIEEDQFVEANDLQMMGRKAKKTVSTIHKKRYEKIVKQLKKFSFYLSGIFVANNYKTNYQGISWPLKNEDPCDPETICPGIRST